MAIDPIKLEQDLSVFGTVDDLNYNDLSCIVVMSNVDANNLTPILSIFQTQVEPDYPICNNFGFSNTNLKTQYIKEVPLPPANNDSEPA